MSNFQLLFSILFQYCFPYCLDTVGMLFEILFYCCSKNFKFSITVLNTVWTLSWKKSEMLSSILSPLLPLHVDIFSKTVCVTVCSWCFFVVANDCPNYYMREIAQVVPVLHHRVRADLPATSQHWVWTIRLKSPLNCATIGKCFNWLSFAFFAGLRATLGTEEWLPYRPKWQSPERSFVWSLCPCCHRIFVVLAPLEAVTAPWSVQPNIWKKRRHRWVVARA